MITHYTPSVNFYPLFFDKMLDFQEINLVVITSKYIQPTYNSKLIKWKLPDYKTYNFYHIVILRLK
jgi:hypothetical protein